MRPRTVLLALLAVTTLAAPVVPVAASPQPTPVCPVCGGALEWTTDADGLNLSTTASTAEVRVHRDGTATWTVTNRLSNETTVEHLRADPERLDALVAEALRYGRIEGTEATEATLARDGTMTVTFRDPDAARREAGTLVVEYVHSRGYETWLVVTADRVAVVAPANWTVANDPPGATVDGRRATWSGDGSAPVYETPRVDRDAYVVFAPEDAELAGGRASLAALVRTMPIVTAVAVSVLLPPLALFALLLGTVSFAARWYLSRERLPDPTRFGAVLLVVAVPVLASAAVGTFESLWHSGRLEVGLGPLLLVAGGVGTLPAVRRWAATPRRLLLLPLVALPLVALFGAALSRPPDRGTLDALRAGVSLAVVFAPLAFAVPLGAALRRGGPRLAFVSVALAFLAGELTVVWPTQRPFGAVVILFVGYAVGAALGALPLLVYGGLLARHERRSGSARPAPPAD